MPERTGYLAPNHGKMWMPDHDGPREGPHSNQGRLGLALYRGLAVAAGAALRPVAAIGSPDLAERLALADPAAPMPETGAIWLHGASVGELNSARFLVDALARDWPLYLTANSLTGRAAARGWGRQAGLAPLDVPAAINRFLARIRPSLSVTVENEIWPNRARLLDRQGIARVVVGARMSARSAARWARMPALIGPVLGGISVLSAQDAATEERLLQLGLPERALVGRLNLKLLAPARIVAGPAGPMRAVTVLAASTHEGEEGVILDAYLAARAHHPDLRLILAPRHPERGNEVAALIAARGLAFARRTAGADETGAAPVLLADTLGEMARWYDAAAICVTGGSFTDRGGHTPWEPAAHLCATLHGPHVANFAEDYGVLDGAEAALQVEGEELGTALAALAGDPARVAQMGARARHILDQRAGDPEALLARITALAARRTCAAAG